MVHNAAVFTPSSCSLRHMLGKWLEHYAETVTLSITMSTAQPPPPPRSIPFPRTPRAFEGDRSVGTRLSIRAGRRLLMEKAIETSLCCWLVASRALLDSHFLTNLTCVAFCYLTRMLPVQGRVDYSPNVKEEYCLPSVLKGSRKLSESLSTMDWMNLKYRWKVV